MIFVTGDCHTEFNKFSTDCFPEQKEMTKDDLVIILGDFGGIWNLSETPSEKYWLNWLNDKNFTIVFIDGNHENFERLNSEFEIVDFCGGKAHKIRDSIFHLMRGEVFEFQGKSFFAFGGARSHDIDDGILSREDFADDDAFKLEIKRLLKRKKQFRLNRMTWWEEELPSDEEYQNAERNLNKHDFKVDYVLTHCAPQSIAEQTIAGGKPDKLTLWLDELKNRLSFRYWFFGHYHEDKKITDKFILLYDQLVRIL